MRREADGRGGGGCFLDMVGGWMCDLSAMENGRYLLYGEPNGSRTLAVHFNLSNYRSTLIHYRSQHVSSLHFCCSIASK
jgi:hypothetical protein